MLETGLGKVQGDWAICKMVVAQGQVVVILVITRLSKVDIPKSKAYKKTRNAKEIDNFL